MQAFTGWGEVQWRRGVWLEFGQERIFVRALSLGDEVSFRNLASSSLWDTLLKLLLLVHLVLSASIWYILS